MKNIEKSRDPQLNKDETSIEELQNKCAKLEQENEELAAKVKWYEEQIRKGIKEKYGSSSEKTPDEQQLSIFNEAEKNQRPNLEEPDFEEITYKRKKSKGLNKDGWEDLPLEVIEYDLPDSKKSCPACNNPLHVMKKEIRKELKIVPAKISVVHHVRSVYACRSCEKMYQHLS